MYTQHSRNARIPENYGGNAFRYPPIGSLGKQTDEPLPPHDLPPEPPKIESDIPMGQDAVAEPDTPSLPTPSLPSGRPSATAPLFPLGSLHGIGSEELLLIGLLLLLLGDGRTEVGGQNNSLVLCLLLLFLCG